MSLIPLPPMGLLAPIVLTLDDVHICESGNYPDKFGQIHRYQLIQWSNNFSDYIPILLEHQPFTWPFFGYVYGMKTVGERLFGNMAFTKYGVQTLHDYRERHMGSGWSVGVAEGKSNIAEVTLCRMPRVSTTHVVTLEGISLDKLDVKKNGIRHTDGTNDLGDQIVDIVREIIDFEARGNEEGAILGMKKLQEFMYCNNIHIPGTSSNSDNE